MAFFMQKKFKEIGHFSRVHGYKGKIVISFNSEDPSILKKNSTIWIEEFGIPSPYKIKEIQTLNKEKRILSLLNLDNKKAEALKNKKVFVDTNDYNLNDDIFNQFNKALKERSSRGHYAEITFIGVNGVGKSTSLSKVAAWLLSNGLSVLVSACDTFRAGAVEQLRTHCQRLEIPLYERGYERDPATIAQEAIVQARRQGIDVVLIDTAGRMQDNEPLMRALSKLISINSPDLVLFVGEALVGNDAVDQIQKFNSALADLDSRGRQRMIDGIIISKFDTIDSKVGAALSMVRASGAPILFVGCGQTYQDLKIPNVGHLLDTLLS